MGSSDPARHCVQHTEEDLLRRNLAALTAVDAELAERISWPVGCDHTRRASSGVVEYRLHREWLPLAVAHAHVDAALRAAGTAPRVLLLGIGLGEQVRALLHAGRHVDAWEHDPWLLRLFLAREDVADELRSRRLVLRLGTDLLEQDVSFDAVIEHPLLARVYRGEIRAARRGRPAQGGSVICAGGLFVEELRDALERRGTWTWCLDVERLSAEELDLALRRLRPERIFAINYIHGLAEFAESHGAELFVWEVDPSTSPVRPLSRACPHAHVFTYRAAHVAGFREAGFEHVRPLPLAADPLRRRPLELGEEDRSRYGAPLVHVGSSMVENAGACRDRLARRWQDWGDPSGRAFDAVCAELLEHQRRDLCAYTLPAHLDALAPGFRAACLASEPAEDPRILFGELVASEKRLAWAAKLAPAGLCVWGDAGWTVVEECGVAYRGSAGHREELTKIYNAAEAHWDVGRLYQSEIVTMRVFDAMACGRPVFTEDSAALRALFRVGEEVLTYRTPEDLLGAVRALAEAPERARELGRRARAAILERHTIDHRLEAMLSSVERESSARR